VLSNNHRAYHAKPARTAVNAVLSRRDLVADHVWKKLEAGDGTAVFLDVVRSCDLPGVPREKGFVRMDVYMAYRYEATADGTKVTLMLRGDPRGSFPASIVNFVAKGQMKLRLESYKSYFIDRKAPDGSDNGGEWPDDERIYSFKVEGEEGGEAGEVGGTTMKDLVASMTVSQAAGLAKPKFIATLRRVLGWSFLLFGACMLVYINTTAGRQGVLCEGEFGACVWGRIEPKLYVRERTRACERLRERSGYAREERLRESEVAARERSGCARAKQLCESEAAAQERGRLLESGAAARERERGAAVQITKAAAQERSGCARAR
jgi:hypothetical protein